MRVGIVAIAVLAVSTVARAQEPKPGQAHPKVDQAKVDAAIERGAKWLMSQGSVNLGHNFTTELSYDELVLYTLIHAGVDYNDAKFKSLLETATTSTLKRTYRTVLTAMALETLDRTKYQNRIADCAQFLADNQCVNGQWFYGEETKLPEREKPKEDVATGGGSGGSTPPSKGGTKALPRIRIVQKRSGGDAGDNSNSQYAALGIRACFNAGVEFDPKIILKAAEWWEKCQQKSKDAAGWGYCHKGQYSNGNLTVQGDDPYGSMTAGGLGSLCIYRWILKQDYKRDKSVVGACNWMASNLKFPENPKYSDTKRWVYYWIYAIERAGMIYGTEKFGSHEWYPEGAEWLLKEQKENGSWVGPETGGAISDTCFAILFLRRATKPLPKVATGGK
jgi:hypothetical protein